MNQPNPPVIRTKELSDWFSKNDFAKVSIIEDRSLESDRAEFRVIFYPCDAGGNYQYNKAPIYLILEKDEATEILESLSVEGLTQ